MSRPPRIVVVGSANMDLVVRAPRFPVPGETLLGGAFAAHPGGKGANQAVAAARLGADVEFVGCVGEPYGRELIAVLRECGVGTDGVAVLPDVASGVGVITVAASGENSIVVASGANARLTGEMVSAHADAIRGADALVLQLETTAGALARATAIAKAAGVPVILNAAPAAPVPPTVLAAVTVLIVNRVEAEMTTGLDGESTPADQLAALLGLGVREAVLTLGAGGAAWAGNGSAVAAPAHPVSAMDTTACGDAFVGAFAVARAEGLEPAECLAFANAAGALAATRPGAIPSLPARAEVLAIRRPSPPARGG